MKPVGVIQAKRSRHSGVQYELSWNPAESRNIVATSVNAQFTHFAAECVRVEVQNSCRALWSVDHSRSSIQSGQDVIAFHVLKAREESSADRALFSAIGETAFERFGRGCVAKIAQGGGSGEKMQGGPEDGPQLRVLLHAR